jgi:hypothetical protein
MIGRPKITLPLRGREKIRGKPVERVKSKGREGKGKEREGGSRDEARE